MTGTHLVVAAAFASVHSVLHSTAVSVTVNLLLFLVAVFWLGLAYWTYRDARRRIGDAWLVGTATALGLVPFVGPLAYLMFRPPETLEEVRVREAELRALESRLARRGDHCPVCRSDVEPSFLICPVCTTQLKQSCGHCSAPLDPLWQACPFCATPVTGRLHGDGEPVPADLDAALTADAHAAGTNGNGKRAARPRQQPSSLD